jgi:hypothetical protein
LPERALEWVSEKDHERHRPFRAAVLSAICLTASMNVAMKE